MKRPILVYAGRPDWYRRPMLVPDEIVAGPKFETRRDGTAPVTVNTPAGAFDMARLADALGPDQAPDGFVVQVNRSGQTLARNLHALSGPKILAVGDTHHMANPVSFVLEYALSERFDAVVLEFTRQHAHWFVEAGFETVRWLPLFSINPRPRPVADSVTTGVAMIGALGDHHPYRRSVVDALRAGGVPVATAAIPQDQAADTYANTAVSLNVSLNGDVNLRIVEVLAAGGCLLTDRLSPQAGLERLFEPGLELLTFTSADDALGQARSLLADPGRTLAIRRAGRARALAEHGGEAKADQMAAIVEGRGVADVFDLAHEPRCRRPVVGADAVLRRVRAYEAVQEFHRIHPVCRAVVGPGLDPRLPGDLADLPRLEIARVAGADGEREAVRQIEADGVSGRIACAAGLDAALEGDTPTAVVLAAAEVTNAALDRLAAGRCVAGVVLCGLRDGPATHAAGVTAALARRGFQSTDPVAAAFERSPPS